MHHAPCPLRFQLRLPKIFLALICLVIGLSRLYAAGFPWRAYANRPVDWFRSTEAEGVLQNVLSHQAPNGGWPKNIDTGAQRFAGDPTDLDPTFDNGATRGELRCLARAYQITGEEVYLTAFQKGLDLILKAQYANGGWPQSYPPGQGYSRFITFNDGTMIGLLELVRDVAVAEEFAFVDHSRRSRAREALDRGIDCILRCQIRVRNTLTAWCAQHDERTLTPRWARSYEHPSISGGESAGVCLFLMSLQDPGPRVVEAVNAACHWFQKVQIRGLRLVETQDDWLVVEDPDAPPLWARFYEIGTNLPIFSGRDGVVKYALAEIERERRTGYSWYVTAPAKVLEAWPAWANEHPLPFDAVAFGFPQARNSGVLWEDPREVHRVVVHFEDTPPPTDQLQLEYWGSWWPERRLPKDREPGGGDVGWMELGNWWKDDWRRADTVAQADDKTVTFTFRPVNLTEFPDLDDYDAPFRYTLKLRVTSHRTLPEITRLEALTDSVLKPQAFRLSWNQSPAPAVVEVFNGRLLVAEPGGDRSQRCQILATVNSDPNTFDRTLVTVQSGARRFTFRYDDLADGPLVLPHLELAVLPENDERPYAAVAADLNAQGAQSLYDRVTELPEQTWSGAWTGMPRKKSAIYFPMGLDGGRQRFRLHADGSIDFRTNDPYLRRLPGRDTPRLDLEPPNVRFRFGLPETPVHRTLAEASLPACTTTWEIDGITVSQTAIVTALPGLNSDGPTPPADSLAVWMARFVITNTRQGVQTFSFPLDYRTGDQTPELNGDAHGLWWTADGALRGQGSIDELSAADQPLLPLTLRLEPGATRTVTLKIPYLKLTETAEYEALQRLDFATEHAAVIPYWRRHLDASAQLITPEPMLDEFYRSHTMHLLINCEREPGSDRRFARVGSFGYGAYGNESCMMVLDLERRGLHDTAQDCLDAWLHYQGTVGLPGSFADHDGVLYGAAGYEAGGYNQHHGWILWMLAEHYRYTRDGTWLQQAAPGILQAADWILRETARTAERHPLERGLLPAGSLEDIGDWWTWLSTSCYTWRGLDNAAWALEQLNHAEARRIREAATAYHTALLNNFRQASERSPVVRLRDGTAVPQFPSHVHRRGRSFGWICQTLEGALHLLITGALDPHSTEAGWILRDYEDNLYLSNQYGYLLDDFEQHWFGRGGMSMQACLLLHVEPYLYRDDVKHALRGLFNAQAVSYFPDVRLNTEHALPAMGDWRGDHFKSSDESNASGWLRYLFVREADDQTLLIGQAVPREWLRDGRQCGLQNTSTWFGRTSVLYEGGDTTLTCHLQGPTRNPPAEIRLRFRHPNEQPIARVTLNGQPYTRLDRDWVILPGDVGRAEIMAYYP